jgi:hypothetical protein
VLEEQARRRSPRALFLASSAHWLEKPKLRGDGFYAALHQEPQLVGREVVRHASDDNGVVTDEVVDHALRATVGTSSPATNSVRPP